MKSYASVCSGIGAPEQAWSGLGWSCSFHAEIEKFPAAVYAHHFNSPNLGDITKFHEWPDYEFDLLVGGTPCQSFSVAGLRKGLADPRGNLALTFLAILERYRPQWLVWENVPGVLSADERRAFGAFLGGLAQLGYGFAYRVFDAQYFDLAQRRERVFVVGHSGGQWQRAAAVLFERESLRWNPSPSREAGQGTAVEVARSIRGRSNASHREDSDTYVARTLNARHDSSYCPDRGMDIVAVPLMCGSSHKAGHNSRSGHGKDATLIPECSPALKSRYYKGPSSDGDGSPLIPIAFDTTQITSNGNYSVPKEGSPCHPLAESAHVPAVAFRTAGNCGPFENGDKTSALNTATDPNQNIVVQQYAVRRLTPIECERLQGFPDNFTRIPWRGKPAELCPDGPRYKALGNSMAVPVLKWIGKRISYVNTL